MRRLTVKDVNADSEGGVYKFVKVAGEYRFCHGIIGSHGDLVDYEELGDLEAAGTIFTFADYWRFEDRHSSGLSSLVEYGKATCGEAEAEELRRLIRRPFRESA